MSPSKRKSQPPEKFDPTPEGSQMMSERVNDHRKKKEDRERKRKERDNDKENTKGGKKNKKMKKFLKSKLFCSIFPK